MALPDNIDITALLAEKCRYSGVAWLQHLSHKTETEAISYLLFLQTRYRSFYSSLTKEEVTDRLSELVYWLSIEGSKILGIALYKELKGSSLQEAYNKQKEIMAMFTTVPLKENLLLQMQQRAINTDSGININRLVNEMNVPRHPAKKHVLLLILLSVSSGVFAYLSVEARRKNDFHGTSHYSLVATFCIMAVVMLLAFNFYKVYVKRRTDRGEVIKKG